MQAASDAEEGEGGDGGDRDGEGDPEEEEDEKTRVPEMYRWVSNAAGLSFSIPVGVLPSAPQGGGMQMAVDSLTSIATTQASGILPPKQLPLCNVKNCQMVRKYRLVSDWEKGACGMGHLKVLQGMNLS